MEVSEKGHAVFGCEKAVGLVLDEFEGFFVRLQPLAKVLHDPSK